MASAALERSLPNRFLALGEVGLVSEVRPVTGLQRLLQEAARLGFTHALVPRGGGENAPESLTVREVGSLPEAMNLLFDSSS